MVTSSCPGRFGTHFPLPREYSRRIPLGRGTCDPPAGPSGSVPKATTTLCSSGTPQSHIWGHPAGICVPSHPGQCPQHLPLPQKPPGGSQTPQGSSGAFKAPFPPRPHLESRLGGKCKKSVVFLSGCLRILPQGRKSGIVATAGPSGGAENSPSEVLGPSRSGNIPPKIQQRLLNSCRFLRLPSAREGGRGKWGKNGEFHEKWGWERLENGMGWLGFCGG